MEFRDPHLGKPVRNLGTKRGRKRRESIPCLLGPQFVDPNRTGLDHGRVRLNFDLFIELPEAGQCCLEPVRTNRQIRQNVRSGFVGDGVARNIRLRLRHGDFDTRQHGSTLILHRTADLGGTLCPHVCPRDHVDLAVRRSAQR